MVESVGPGGRGLVPAQAEPKEVSFETTTASTEAPKKTRKKKTSE